MAATVKKLPAFKASMYDIVPSGKRRYKGKEVMDVVIYLPVISVPCSMKPRFVSYREGPGKNTAIVFTGAQIALDDKRLRRLCGRLALARKSLVAYVRRLAA